ncbi:nuclear transport factor 2 family protein [Actinoplanes sp. RD1]|uniref:nuclear transport factor 2 family protein n=1 Tax=Actinoplanes sp. RD1 TaxID=3064538 RepID=UPI0027424539|nr:nuclear transport factor 2 family protein [Actinoplanes sp. RD1]
MAGRPAARYLPGHGPELHGLDAIRKEFAPQFAGRFGAMVFDVYDTVIDETRRKATIRWACKLDLSGGHGRRASAPLRLFARLRHGGHVQWHGLDVFHFDAAGRISGKFTYATFRLPLWEGFSPADPTGTRTPRAEPGPGR